MCFGSVSHLLSLDPIHNFPCLPYSIFAVELTICMENLPFFTLSLAYLSHFNHLLTEEEMEEEVMRNMKDYVDGGKFDLFDAVLIGSLDFIS